MYEGRLLEHGCAFQVSERRCATAVHESVVGRRMVCRMKEQQGRGLEEASKQVVGVLTGRGWTVCRSSDAQI